MIRAVEARPGDEATVTELDLKLEEWASTELKSVAADFYYALFFFCKGKALKIVLTNKEGDGFEAWRAFDNKYELTVTSSVPSPPSSVAQSCGTISDSFKIGCVIAGMGQSL